MPMHESTVIEFAGMPKSGKTTTLNAIAQLLRRGGQKIQEFHGGGRFSPIDKEHLGNLNAYLLAEAIRYLTAIDHDDRPPRVHLMDRGVVDRAIFSTALFRLGRISCAQRDLAYSALQCDEVFSPVNLVLLFVGNPELSLERDMKLAYGPGTGRVMNVELLEALRTATIDGEWRELVSADQVEMVNTAALDGDFQNSFRLVAATIIQHCPHLTPLMELVDLDE